MRPRWQVCLTQISGAVVAVVAALQVAPVASVVVAVVPMTVWAVPAASVAVVVPPKRQPRPFVVALVGSAVGVAAVETAAVEASPTTGATAVTEAAAAVRL